jgi:hypothetical protein
MKKTQDSPRSERQKATLSGSIGYISEDGFVLGSGRATVILRHPPGPLDEAIAYLDAEIAECRKRA